LDKYGFAPTDGEFRGVRTFGRQVKHLAATNYILAAAALGLDPPADAGDGAGPDGVRTKDEVLSYLKGSFARRAGLDRASRTRLSSNGVRPLVPPPARLEQHTDHRQPQERDFRPQQEHTLRRRAVDHDAEHPRRRGDTDDRDHEVESQQ